LGSGESALLWVSLGVVLGVVGLVVGRTSTGAPALRTPLRRVVIAGWLAICPLAILLLVAFGGVEVGRWGGLYLNYLITATAALGAFPIGVLMALGRRSGYRVIRMSCTTMMDATRSLPLIVVLLVSALAIQRLLPTLWGINEAGLFIRILAAYTLFTSVYVAVCVSGGLAGLPRGQSEAALALGLTPTQVNRSVLLPQGIRRAIPSLTGELIDLLMASTLISVLGMTDILAAARATTEQPAFFGRQKEVLLVVGVVFWATAFSLSRLGRAAERALAPRSGREGTAQR
ncbi:MAG: ABC transporter permease subunit, partial [Dehalococcoidia bacterium]